MKRLSLIFSVLLMCVCSSVNAQDAAPVMYIPGMPVPQTEAASAAPSEGDAAAPAQNGGKISRITKAGDMYKQPEPSADADANKAGSDNNRPDYKGVTPPKRLVPENAATFSRTSANQMSWIGFMPEEGEHRIFLQTTEPTPYEQVASASDRIEIRLIGAKLAVSNNHRQLDMSYFKTPFKYAKADASGKDVRVVVLLKEAVPYEIRQHDNMTEIVVKPANVAPQPAN